MTFLADTFRDLAHDPSWPWPSIKYKDPWRRVTIARLALMVVEKMESSGIDVECILENECINPDHYANVKKRVQEADTEEVTKNVYSHT